MRHGDTFDHFASAAAAHPGGSCEWQIVHGFGTFSVSVVTGVMNRNVCASTVGARGPFGEFGPWHSRHRTFAGLIRSALLPVPCTSWQSKQVMPRVYMTLVTKSLPCMRFLCAVPSAKCVKVCSPGLCSSRRQ